MTLLRMNIAEFFGDLSKEEYLELVYGEDEEELLNGALEKEQKD